MYYTIRVSDDVLESMSLAAIEAYCLGDGRAKPEDKLETLGYIWGFKKIEDNITFFYVNKLALSISATREKESVTPHPQAADLKDELVRRWSPQFILLGDFHTHPYEDLVQVKRIGGFEFSAADFRSFKTDDRIWQTSGNSPLMLAMTICRLNRVRDTWGTQTRDNICSFSMGEFRFWLNVSVGFLDDSGTRRYTGNKRSRAFLDLNSRFFNLGGDRIQRRTQD